MARRHKHFGVAHARLAWPPLWQPNCRFSIPPSNARRTDLVFEVCQFLWTQGQSLSIHFNSYGPPDQHLRGVRLDRAAPPSIVPLRDADTSRDTIQSSRVSVSEVGPHHLCRIWVRQQGLNWGLMSVLK